MTFQPGVYDLFVFQNTDWSINVTWRINEFQVDPTGFKAALTVKPEATSQRVILYMSTENGRINTTELPGWLVLKLDAATTGALPTNRFVYDLIVNDGSRTWPFLRGRFVVRGGLTSSEVPNLVSKGSDYA
jgi:hypothetical protein